MNKKTINNLLYATMGVLFIGICVLIFKISTRPHYVFAPETIETAIIPEIESTEVAQTYLELPTEEQNNEQPEEEVTALRGKASSMVNIRELPSTDSRVLETVEKDYPFEILEILNDGWTKIQYGDSEAYVSSQFVILVH